MIKISKAEREALDKVGLLKYGKRARGVVIEDANFTVVNKHHCGRNKRYYVTETPEIMKFLGRFESFNLQVIRPDQLRKLIDSNLVKEDNIQRSGEYKPEATVYIDDCNKIRCEKITKYMLTLGIWKTNKEFKK